MGWGPHLDLDHPTVAHGIEINCGYNSDQVSVNYGTRTRKEKRSHPVADFSCRRRGEFDRVWCHPPSLESEISLARSGVVLVPRLRSYPPCAPESLDHTKYWMVDRPRTVVQTALPSPTHHQLLIKISVFSESAGGLCGVVGTITRSGSPQWKTGTRVITVIPSAPSNFTLVHKSQIAEMPESVDKHHAASVTLPLILAGLAVHLDSRPIKSLRQSQVVVLDSGRVASSIARFLDI